MSSDYILNGQAFGGVALQLVRNGMDFDSLRPYAYKGRSYVDKRVVNPKTGKVEKKAVQIANVATLRRDDWLRIDEAVTRVAKPTLRAIGDLRAAGLTVNINGLGTPVLAYETMGDITGATISMDGLRESEKDRPVFDIKYLPIPIIHKDLSFSARQLAVAEAGGTALDTVTVEMAARRVAESAEELLLGTSTSYSYGGGTVYGYTNFPSRITKAMTLPTAAGWTPQVMVNEILDMKQSLINKFRSGPYVMYTSSNWDLYLDDDYSAAYNGNTLRSRLSQINGISAIRTLDYLTGYQVLIVQMTSDVIQEVIGMDIRTVQWESKGGMEVNFKVMCIMVPRIRMDMDNNVGIAHGTAT